MKIIEPRSLDDDALAATLQRLAGVEREATVALILHLAEFDQRQLYRGAGFRSLFEYCVEVLRLSEDAASNRIAAARMARRFPESSIACLRVPSLPRRCGSSRSTRHSRTLLP